MNEDRLRSLAEIGAQALIAELTAEFPRLAVGVAAAVERATAAAQDSPEAAPTQTSARVRGTAKGRRKMSAANRKAVSERMKAYWAARRRSQGSKQSKRSKGAKP